MKVRLMTIDVSDEIRHALRQRIGKSGLATREEVRRYAESYIDMDLEIVMDEYRETVASRASE